MTQKKNKNNWGRLRNILPTCYIKEITTYFNNEDYQYTSVFEGICISQITADRAKIYFEDLTYFCRFC